MNRSHLFILAVGSSALDRDAHQVQVTWDPMSGAPQDSWIDYDANIADEEQGYRIVSAPRAPS